MMHLPYAEQLRRKENQVRALLGRYGKVSPILGMENPYHYRNKVQAAFKRLPDGRILSGVYQSGSHRVVPVDDCLLEDRTPSSSPSVPCSKASRFLCSTRTRAEAFCAMFWSKEVFTAAK